MNQYFVYIEFDTTNMLNNCISPNFFIVIVILMNQVRV